MVAEVKKSRRLSNSRRLLANAPAEAGRAAMRMPITCSKIRLASLRSAIAAGAVDEVGAQIAQYEVEYEHCDHAGREHPERLDGMVRHHAVVDVHDEQRAGEGEQVDQHRGKQDFGVDRPGLGERAPEPAARLGSLHLVGAPVEAQLRAREQGMTGVPFGDLGERQLDCAAALGNRHQRALARQQLDQHACREVVEQKHAWQGECADAIEPLAHQAGAEAGALGGAHRQLRRQPTIGQRQTGL